jgi:serine/threonine protein kinase
MATQPQPTKQDRFSFDTKPHAEGGFARVIKGRDNYLERQIAVKILNPLATQFAPADQERFRREARILARLSHPNIPSIYDVDFGPGRFIIVSQFIEGPTLRSLIEQEGVIDLSKAQLWFRQIGSALDHAHSLGIVHRDIKPDNIIITPDHESAYLVDFGIALSAQEQQKLTKSGVWIGTPGYMSPEQQAGEEVDTRSDLFSLAVTLYEALSGKAIPQGQYEELAVGNQAIPPQIDDLVRACLEPKDRRLESAKTFISRLSSALIPVRPLSEVLAHGKLHEIAVALRDVTADGFMRLPEGQRALILVKLDDVVGSDNPNLQYAAAQFLELLLIRGLLLDKDNYRQIVSAGIERGFEREFEGRTGRSSLRDVLEEAASLARPEAHEVLREEFTSYLERANLDQLPGWLLHDIREMLQALLANPACTQGAKKLAEQLKRVNKIQTQMH